MYFIVVCLLIAYCRAQSSCSCSCCLGQNCQLTLVGTVYSQNCSTDNCLAQCRCSYPQCLSSPPYGQVSAQCTPPTLFYNCQCQCCSIGTSACVPSFVGYANAYSCQPGACSIACAAQYPSQCVSNQYGQTQGTCLGLMTTTTAMTTTAFSPWLGNVCSCTFCQSGSSCPSNLVLGITSASQCSSSACNQACQNRYSRACPLPLYSGQINGVCLSETSGNIKCRCKCCVINNCLEYELSTNGTSASCETVCRQYLPCENPTFVTYNSTSNRARTSTNASLGFVLLVAALLLLSSRVRIFY